MGSRGSQITKRSCTKSTASQRETMSHVSQPSTKSSRNVYLSQFLYFFHAYIDDIIDVDNDGNYGFCTIDAQLGRGEESWNLVRAHLDTQVRQHHKLYSKLFYDT